MEFWGCCTMFISSLKSLLVSPATCLYFLGDGNSSVSSLPLWLQDIVILMGDGGITSRFIISDLPQRIATIALRKLGILQAYKNWFIEQLTKVRRNCRSRSQWMSVQSHASQRFIMYIIMHDGIRHRMKNIKINLNALVTCFSMAIAFDATWSWQDERHREICTLSLW